MSDVQFFDPDNYLLEPHQSLGLQPIKPALEVVETPPPAASRDSSSELTQDEEEGWTTRGNERLRDRERHPQGEGDLCLNSSAGANPPQRRGKPSNRK